MRTFADDELVDVADPKVKLARFTLAQLLVEDFGWTEDQAENLRVEYELGRGILTANDEM